MSVRSNIFTATFVFLFLGALFYAPGVHADNNYTCQNGTIVTYKTGVDPKTLCPTSSCGSSQSFFGFPSWDKFLPKTVDANGKCVPSIEKCDSTSSKTCYKTADNFSIDTAKIWLIALAIVDMLLRLGGLVAVFMVIYGGFRYITSQGNPESTKNARQTIIYAVVGIAITLVATITVNFVAKLIL